MLKQTPNIHNRLDMITELQIVSIVIHTTGQWDTDIHIIINTMHNF